MIFNKICTLFLLLIVFKEAYGMMPELQKNLPDRKTLQTFVIDQTTALNLDSNPSILNAQALVINAQLPNHMINQVQKLKELQSIVLGHKFQFQTDKTCSIFFKGIQKIKKLRNLDLSGKEFGCQYLIYIPKSVKELNLSNTYILWDALKTLPQNLKILDVSISSITEDDILSNKSLLKSMFPHIEEIRYGKKGMLKSMTFL